MMRKRYCYSILALLLVVFLCHPAIAAKCVKPNGNGGCFDSVQDAIDAVAPGGTVQVYPGIYYEFFNANKPGITIEGMGNKRTDVRIDQEGVITNLINASNVTIKNLTIQNGFQGILINSTGSNSKILRVNIFASVHNGILIMDADDILFKNCTILKSEEDGVNNPGGARLTVENTTISDCNANGIYCGGDELTVDGCTIKSAGEHLIHVEGYPSQATIRNNKLFKAGGYGMRMFSDFAKVTGNFVRETTGYGIFIRGESPVVKENTVLYSQTDGFYLFCVGTDPKIVNNLSNFNGANGFGVYSDYFVLFKKNKAFNNEAYGIYTYGNGDKMIVENQSRYNTGNGFYVEYGTLENNIASHNGDKGYELNGENTAVQNRALNNMSTGFFIYGPHNLLRGNKATGNLTNGIHVTGDNNDIINNTALDSLCDIYDQGSNNTWTNNTYDTECP